MTADVPTTRAALVHLSASLPEGKMQITRDLIAQILPTEENPNAIDVGHAITMMVRSIAQLDQLVSQAIGYDVAETD